MGVYAAGAAVIGLGYLAVLWPGRRQGVQVLTRWGVDEPGPTEVKDAVGYLKRRRLWYPWVFFTVAALVSVHGESGLWAAAQTLVGALAVGALLAEVLAQWPARRARRAATGPCSVRDLVSPWSVAALGALLAVVVGVSVLSLAGVPWARQAQPDPARVLGEAALVSVIGAGVVALAVRRPAAGTVRADGALRLRSARVGLGLTMGALGIVFSTGESISGRLVAGVAVLCWIATVNPPRALLRRAVARA